MQTVVKSLYCAGIGACVSAAVIVGLYVWTMAAEQPPVLVQATLYPVWSGAAFSLLNGVTTLLAAKGSVRPRARWWRWTFHLCVISLVAHSVYLAFSLATPFICPPASETKSYDYYMGTTVCSQTTTTIASCVLACVVALCLIAVDLFQLYAMSNFDASMRERVPYDLLNSPQELQTQQRSVHVPVSADEPMLEAN